jgi:hypothetical protein
MATNTKTTPASRTKADGYATIVVTDKNGDSHRIESQDAWLFATKNTGDINPVNSSLLKAAQANREAYQTYQNLSAKAKAKVLTKGDEPKSYIEVPAMIQIKVPAVASESTQGEIQF